MRLRLIDIEYKDLEEDEMIERIRRIYIEEYGKELSVNVDVFNSFGSSVFKYDESSYDGTSIHFYT
ncbi:DUF6792 domain-containing protein [Virgibacillus necropolis]|nr:DUF6792 domain-containing protein [Virgibacillus necropolis]